MEIVLSTQSNLINFMPGKDTRQNGLYAECLHQALGKRFFAECIKLALGKRLTPPFSLTDTGHVEVVCLVSFSAECHFYFC